MINRCLATLAGFGLLIALVGMRGNVSANAAVVTPKAVHGGGYSCESDCTGTNQTCVSSPNGHWQTAVYNPTKTCQFSPVWWDFCHSDYSNPKTCWTITTYSDINCTIQTATSSLTVNPCG
jgi:hypothetical protein